MVRLLSGIVRLTVFVIFLCGVTAFISAQQNSGIAVLPFTPVEASENEAKVVTSLFETAFVKTGVYHVIEQSQIEEILNVQAFSLSGCTDEACAVEVGKLLSAELIILGELSSVGGRYIANAKIIDVALGKNVNADSVTTDTISEMTDEGVILLAYRLAGLPYTTKKERMRESFSREIEELSERVASGKKTAPDSDVLQKDLADSRSLHNRMKEYRREFPELEIQARNLFDAALSNRIDELKARLGAAKKIESERTAGKAVLHVMGAAGFILSGVLYFIGEAELETYSDSRAPSAALESRQKLETYALLQTAGLAAGGAGTLIGLLIPGKDENIDGWNAEITRLSAERARLHGGVWNE